MRMRGDPTEGWQGASCPPLEADKSSRLSSSPSTPPAGSSNANYSSVFEGLPPSQDATHLMGWLQSRLPVLKKRARLSPRTFPSGAGAEREGTRTATRLKPQRGKADGQRGVGGQSVFTSVCILPVSAGRRAGKSCALGCQLAGCEPSGCTCRVCSGHRSGGDPRRCPEMCEGRSCVRKLRVWLCVRARVWRWHARCTLVRRSGQGARAGPQTRQGAPRLGLPPPVARVRARGRPSWSRAAQGGVWWGSPRGRRPNSPWPEM